MRAAGVAGAEVLRSPGSRPKRPIRRPIPVRQAIGHRRLDLEAMRDAMMAVSGRLDTALGGRSVDIVEDAANRRRTIYGLVDRQSLPSLYRAFDFASPDQSAERRPQTTV